MSHIPPLLPPITDPLNVDPALGRRIIDLHIWAVRAGLRGAAVDDLLDGYCQQLVIAGVPLWRGFAGMRTLHPQWGGYGYTWRRDLNAIEHATFERSAVGQASWVDSPFHYLMSQTRGPGAEGLAALRRHLTGPEAQLDFPVLAELAAAGATDYFAQFFRFGT